MSTDLARLAVVYGEPSTPEEHAVRDALACTDRTPSVQLALETLDYVYQCKGELPEVQRLERYVAEAWAEQNAIGGRK